MVSLATKEALKRNFLKPLIAAGVGGFLYETEGLPGFQVARPPGLLSAFGGSWSPMVTGGALGFVAAFLTESLNNIVHSIDKQNRTKNYVSFVTHVAGSALSWAALPVVISSAEGRPNMTALKRFAKVGVMTEMISQWLHENFVEHGSFGADVLAAF